MFGNLQSEDFKCELVLGGLQVICEYLDQFQGAFVRCVNGALTVRGYV